MTQEENQSLLSITKSIPKKRYWIQITVISTSLFAFALVLWVIRSATFPNLEYEGLTQNVAILLFVNLNLVFLCLLVFLVGRNVVHLLFDWRNNILGAKLRVKLVCLLVGLVLVPTALLFLFANRLFSSAMEGWLAGEARETRLAALSVAREHFASVEDSAIRHLESIATKISNTSLGELSEILSSERRLARMAVIAIDAGSKDSLIISHAPQRDDYARRRINQIEPEVITRVLRGERVILSSNGEKEEESIAIFLPVKIAGKPGVLIGISLFSEKISKAFRHISDAFRDYEQIRLFRAPIRSGYLLTFTMVTGMILFSAIWVAFYLARQIVGPIESLVSATSKVARGDYSIRINAKGDDELSYLVRSFNTMVADLQESRAQAEQRRLLIEVTLRHLTIGVVSINKEQQITLMNPAARLLFGVDVDLDLVDAKLKDLLPTEWRGSIDAILDDAEGGSPELLVQDLKLSRQGRELEIVMTAGPMYGADKALIGAVILFDDVTELNQAQQMAAWREVARRIAHEIKNPLTPLQLSAQRIHKLLPTDDSYRSLRESAETIVENVGSIERLANEFSKFARMPTAEFRLADLNEIVADILESYATDVPKIFFQGITDTRLQPFYFDPEQIRRLLINLIDNSVDALRYFVSPDNHFQPRIAVNTKCDRKRRRVVLEVIDNGPGIPDDQKGRVFDPYFTNKKGGTGLGLAIVNSIVADHQGRIRIFDNIPSGVRFVVEIPLEGHRIKSRRV